MQHLTFAGVLSTTFFLGLAACDHDGAPQFLSSVARSEAPRARCEITVRSRPLSDEIRETSGLARSRKKSDLFWTHNDSGNESILFGLDGEGRIISRVRVEGADFQDWEDLEATSCRGGSCLMLADIGDNQARRPQIAVHQVAEPASQDKAARIIKSVHASYPDRAQDAEAIFQLASEGIFLVTKGRHGPISLYRFPEGDTAAPSQLTKVREIWPRPAERADWVSSATATPDGRWVVLRTYRTLHFFLTRDLLDGKGPSARFELTGMDQLQGEAIAVANDGAVWLTAEARRKNDLPQWSRLSCDLPAAGQARR